MYAQLTPEPSDILSADFVLPGLALFLPLLVLASLLKVVQGLRHTPEPRTMAQKWVVFGIAFAVLVAAVNGALYVFRSVYGPPPYETAIPILSGYIMAYLAPLTVLLITIHVMAGPTATREDIVEARAWEREAKAERRRKQLREVELPSSYPVGQGAESGRGV